MKAFQVIAGWCVPEEIMGICHIEAARGKEVISFSYDETWLRRHPGFVPDPDLSPSPGRQYPPADKSCFGFLQDIAPDRWGRTLMDRRERIDAAAEMRPARRLTESDYILGVHDAGRMGALRLKDPGEGCYISNRQTLAAPPMTQLRKLEQASLRLEEDGHAAEEKWFRDLIEPGSSLGGARPKANVTDENGALWIAKFPSHRDTVNVGAWEMLVHDLAHLAGIDVPEAKCMRLSERGDTFLVRRFDRKKDRRIHYASAMTMLGYTDGGGTPADYVEVAGVLEQIGAHPEEDLRELWRRAVFSLCVSNTDNHLRNHGFLLTNEGWRLSPAFDINPSADGVRMELPIGGDDLCHVDAAIAAADYFRISKDEARQIAEEIRQTVAGHLATLAKIYGIGTGEQKRMREAFRNVMAPE